jgi:predicted RNA-binding protein with PUA-like domain
MNSAGVRNPTASKNMRQMKQGDMAFFYASGGKVPGITGIMEVVKEHEPDRTAWDENAYGYVENEKNRDKWCVVHVEFRNKLTKPVTRPELVAATKEGGPLAKMQEFTAARLSVSKVSEEEWVYINSLVEGFEDEDDAVMKDTSGAEEGNVEDNDDENDASSNLPGTAGSPPIESDLPPQEVPTTDTIFPAEPEQKTSMPVIETSSRPTSRSSALGGLAIKPSSSRAGSLAPPAGRRSRSKTPSARAGSVQPPSSAIVQDGTGMNAITEE